jgi:hypothetical protein
MLVASLGEHRVRRLSSLQSLPRDAELLVIPGGDATFLDGKDKIIDFVHKGGKFLGICAGAIEAIEKSIFKPGVMYDNDFKDQFKQGKVVIRSLNQEPRTALSCSKAIVPHIVKDPEKRGDHKNLVAVAVRFAGENETFMAAHFSGPAFVEIPKEAEPILAYEDPVDVKEIEICGRQKYKEEGTIYKENPVAAFSCSYGSGIYVLTGVHPEFDPATFNKAAAKRNFGPLPQELADHEPNRQAFIARIIQKLKITL